MLSEMCCTLEPVASVVWRQAAFDASSAFAPALVLRASAEITACKTSEKNMKSCKISQSADNLLYNFSGV
jgi:hypothetical protein